jgi:hypothetical protein
MAVKEGINEAKSKVKVHPATTPAHPLTEPAASAAITGRAEDTRDAVQPTAFCGWLFSTTGRSQTEHNMEQITTSLAVRTAPKVTVSGSGSDAAGSVTKRFLPLLIPNRSMLTSSRHARLSNELMTLMVSGL